ncbi:MFS transporter [Arthrobacter sp. NPDC080073]|uniref:MFS transporter n=1 Tax=Arthrobacter sp. NPDC080073 TaxID=3155919 RepID=UPI00342C841A
MAFAAGAGALVESYDFGIYGFAAAFVFPHTFFPSLGSSAAMVASMATLGVAFVTRPAGAILFGYLGDRYGRKKTLIATVLGMGLCTVAMGLVPSAQSIGVSAPIIVVTLRAFQGLAFGGEWAGAQLFATEHAPSGRRGLYGMFPQVGNGLANVLGPLTLLGVSSFGQSAFQEWAWRIPFLASGILVLIAFYIRMRVEETPIFAKEQVRGKTTRQPLLGAVKQQPWTIALSGGALLTTFAFYFSVQTFIPHYGVDRLGLSQNEVLGVTALAGLIYGASSCVSAVISDNYGRRPVVAVAQVFGVIWGMALFPVLAVPGVVTFAVALCATTLVAGVTLGALGVLIPEQFPTQYRYTAVGLSYQLAAVVGGGVIPIVAPIITASSYGPIAFGVVLAVIAAIAALCTLWLKEGRNKSMEWTIE